MKRYGVEIRAGEEGILSIGIEMFVKTNEAGYTELLDSEETCLPVEVPSLHVLSLPVPYNRVVSTHCLGA